MKWIIISSLLVALVKAEVCGKPTISNKNVYTTTERRLSDSTAFVTKFSLSCSSGSQGLPIFAELNGNIFPVTKSLEGNVYQLSWIAGPSEAKPGNYPVRFFDDEGINAVRKAIRNGEDTSNLKPLFEIDVNHPGNSRDLWISSEAVGLLLAGLFYYAVCQLRSEVVN